MDKMSQVIMRRVVLGSPKMAQLCATTRHSKYEDFTCVCGPPNMKKMPYNFIRWSHTLVKILSPWGSYRPLANRPLTSILEDSKLRKLKIILYKKNVL